MSDFNTQVNGTPCICRVTHYSPYQPPRGMHGPMEDAEEEIPSEFEFELLYPGGLRAIALEESLGQSDIDRLQDEYEASILAIKHGKDF